MSDPHEIANVLGIKGVEFMIQKGNKSGFKFYFGASSCVPATPFETSGATLTPDDIDTLLQKIVCIGISNQKDFINNFIIFRYNLFIKDACCVGRNTF